MRGNGKYAAKLFISGALVMAAGNIGAFATYWVDPNTADPTCGGQAAGPAFCFHSIQAAIDSAPNGELILVRAGTYVENVWMHKDLQVVKPADFPLKGGNPAVVILPPDCGFNIGGVRITGYGNTLEGFTITDTSPGDPTDPNWQPFAHAVVKVEGDNNSVFNNTITGRGFTRDNNSDIGVFVVAENFASSPNDGISYFTNVKRNKLTQTCIGINLDMRINEFGQPQTQDDTGVSCNDVYAHCKGVNIVANCDVIPTLGETFLRPVSYNNFYGAFDFAAVQIEYKGSCDPPIDVTNNWWNDPSGPNVDGTGTPGAGWLLEGWRNGDISASIGNNVSYGSWLATSVSDECPPPAPAKIGNYVWEDNNFNGAQDAGEPGSSGVTVNLYKCTGTLSATATTDANGAFQFQASPGDYYLEFVTPSGYLVTKKNTTASNTDSDADPVTSRTTCTNLAGGEDDTTWDAGIYRKAKIGDFVWSDGNADGNQEASSSGISGAVIKLYTCGGTYLSSVTTTSTGKFSFDVDPGDYYLAATAPGGYKLSRKALGTDRNIDSDFDPVTGRTDCTNLTSGEDDKSIDAGLNQKGTISDRVWKDSDKDGIQDSGETGFSGVTVKLLNCSGSTLQTTTTNSSGNYSFSEIDPACYVVRFYAPSGYGVSPSDKGGNDNLDSDARSDGKTPQFNLGNAQMLTNWDCGFKK